jgi:hypothetical protein
MGNEEKKSRHWVGHAQQQPRLLELVPAFVSADGYVKTG